MSRINIRRNSINAKIMAGILLVFTLGIIFIYGFTSRRIEKNYISQIEEDLIDIHKNVQFYTRQALIINEENNDEAGFKRVVGDIINELQTMSTNKYIAYDLEGSIISQNNEEGALHSYKEDLNRAIDGEMAFTLIKQGRDKLSSNFSTPVFIEGNKIGIIRLNKDYSKDRAEGNAISMNLLLVILIVFIMAYFILTKLLKHLLSPALSLANHSTMVTAGMEDNRFMNGTIPNLEVRKSNDEIGELINNYNHMLDKINEQFELIRQDRNSIIELYNHKQDFYNNVTHELKTPLTTIKGYAEIINNNGFNDKEFFNKGMNHIMDESERLHNMVIQLLEMAQFSERRIFQRINLSLIIKSVVDGMSLKAKRYGNTFELDLEDNIPIMGDEDKVKELIINILDNAIKYGKENTKIIIKGYKDGTNIKVSITNEGRGLTEEEQEAVFTPFYRIDKQRSRESGSAGLGLSICKKIVEGHDGYITIESEVDKETTFLVVFPILKEEGLRI